MIVWSCRDGFVMIMYVETDQFVMTVRWLTMEKVMFLSLFNADCVMIMYVEMNDSVIILCSFNDDGVMIMYFEENKLWIFYDDFLMIV